MSTSSPLATSFELDFELLTNGVERLTDNLEDVLDPASDLHEVQNLLHCANFFSGIPMRLLPNFSSRLTNINSMRGPGLRCSLFASIHILASISALDMSVARATARLTSSQAACSYS